MQKKVKMKKTAPPPKARNPMIWVMFSFSVTSVLSSKMDWGLLVSRMDLVLGESIY